MKHTKLFIATASLLTAFVSTNLFAAELIVEVDNIQEVKGSIYLSLYKDEKSFDANSNFVARQKATVDKKTVRINLGDLPAGDYAIKAYHDVNNNGRMDFNGPMPEEPFGTSSKSKEMAPPNYQDAKFTLDKNQLIKIHLMN